MLNISFGLLHISIRTLLILAKSYCNNCATQRIKLFILHRMLLYIFSLFILLAKRPYKHKGLSGNLLKYVGRPGTLSVYHEKSFWLEGHNLKAPPKTTVVSMLLYRKVETIYPKHPYYV